MFHEIMPDKARKQILFIIPSLEGGGAEHVFINMLSAFDFDKFEVTTCLGVKKGIYLQSIPSKVRITNLFRNKLEEKIVLFFHRNLNFGWLVSIIVNHRIKGSYDVGISFIDSYYTDFLIKLKGKISKSVAWVHASFGSYNNYSRFYKGNYKNRIINERYKKLDRIIFVSNDSRNEFQQIFGVYPNTSIIYNVFDIEGIRKNAESGMTKFEKDGTVNLLAVGNLIPVKAYDKLINAAALLKRNGVNFKLRILGDGYLRNELSELIYELNLGDKVELTGFELNPYSFMKASDIFVMTSISEALPTALCEAMIIGLPCVVTSCSGCREIIGEGEYGIMTGNSPEEIFVGLRKMISDNQLREDFKKRALRRSLIFDDMSAMESIYSLL